MASDTLYQTERLIARRWREADRAGLAALNADPAVMRYFPEALTRAKSDAFFDRLQQRQRDDGFVFPASFTATQNTPSSAVMARIGMTRDPTEDFDHPALDAAHPLARHVLYRLTRQAWTQAS